jgi:predicted ATPase
MLTRLEVDGFKNLLDFSLDFGPFNCIAGPNGVGKSNILDVVRFLSLLSEKTIAEAAMLVRGENAGSSDPGDLFWTDGKDRISKMSIAAEMIVDGDVTDDFGRGARATSSYLRYQLEIGYEPAGSRNAVGRLHLISESLAHITQGEASTRLGFPHSAKNFRRIAVYNNRRAKAYISTTKASDKITEINVHQDGGSKGPPQKAPAENAPRTIIGTTNTTLTPTILAAKREMQSWRFLALEPTAMRRSNKMHEDPHITASGDHLAATLHRLERAENEEDEEISPNVVSSRVAQRLSEIIPVKGLRIDVDLARQLLTLEVCERSGAYLPARSLSDGTLRFLTLCLISEDPEFKGLLGFEEPENGIHPAKMPAMVELLRELAVDPTEPPDEDNPMRQVLTATHSPSLVQLQNKDDLLYADVVKIRGPFGGLTSTIRCKPLSGSWRNKKKEDFVGLGSILAYLTAPQGAQLTLYDQGSDLG